MVAAVFFLLFTACGKDDDTDKSDAEKTAAIVGKWNFEKFVSKETPGETETFTARDGEWIEFKNDGTASQRVYNEDEEEYETSDGLWRIKGGKLYLEDELTDLEESIEDGDGVTIIKLTSSELVVKEEDSWTDEVLGVVKWESTTYLKK